MKYQVGDKVRIVSNKVGDKWNLEGLMDKWLGKVMTIRAIDGDKVYNMFEDQEERWDLGWCWHEHMIDCKMAFKVKCTKSDDDRFIIGKEYYVDEHGHMIDEHGYSGTHESMLSFKAWYKDCNWVDYAFELLEDYTKVEVEDNEEEVKMNKYNVGEFVEFDYENRLKGVGKIVRLDEDDDYMPYLIELPEKYHGQGHDGDGRYEEDNYLWIGDKHISCKVEKTELKEEVEEEIKATETKVEDQFLYKCNTKADGSIAFNKVKMLNLCFVKYNPNGQVYTFINPTNKLLKEGTKVLVDSAGRDSVGYVVASVKVQKKCAKDLLYAMTGKRGLELKYVLGVYETKIKQVEVEEVTRF